MSWQHGAAGRGCGDAVDGGTALPLAGPTCLENTPLGQAVLRTSRRRWPGPSLYDHGGELAIRDIIGNCSGYQEPALADSAGRVERIQTVRTLFSADDLGYIDNLFAERTVCRTEILPTS